MKFLKLDSATGEYSIASDESIFAEASRLAREKLMRIGDCNSPGVVAKFLRLHFGHNDFERFCVVFLDTQNKVISLEFFGSGTIDQCTVHPREIARRALLLNARSVILSHNHPSGKLEASVADIKITEKIKSCLETIDCRVLDHIIVTGFESYFSFSEKGML